MFDRWLLEPIRLAGSGPSDQASPSIGRYRLQIQREFGRAGLYRNPTFAKGRSGPWRSSPSPAQPIPWGESVGSSFFNSGGSDFKSLQEKEDAPSPPIIAVTDEKEGNLKALVERILHE